MPDKHEVGGSSPLGPTKNLSKKEPKPLKEISFKGGSSPLGPTNTMRKQSVTMEKAKPNKGIKDKKEEKRSLLPHTSSLFTRTSYLNYGGVAQLGEHLPCKQGVMGSNPIISTKEQRFLKMFIENRIRK